jgi:type IV pilus assembly protein PilM
MSPSLSLSLGRRSATDAVGLDIQPGLVAAVKARVNGSVLVERAVAMTLPTDVVREGDVIDAHELSDALRELFAGAHLGKRVRVGVANQRTVMRTLELPPLTDAKELAAAVQFQAQDQVPMPLANAVLDFQPLGIVETPAGPRQKVVVVAAQRDMVERLLAAVRQAGLTPVGVDMSAFALIRSLYRPEGDQSERVLYLNVDGLTNVAIAEGTACRFTRVLGGGIEEIAAELAERRGIPLAVARELLGEVDLSGAEAVREAPPAATEPAPGTDLPAQSEAPAAPEATHAPQLPELPPLPEPTAPAEAHERPPLPEPADVPWAPAGGVEAPESVEAPASAPPPAYEDEAYAEELAPAPDLSALEDARHVLESGIRAIAGEVRNSLDFHRSQEGGGDVSRVVLSGSALGLAGFAESLQTALGVEVHGETVALANETLPPGVSVHRLAVATGLAATEVAA